MVINQLTCKNPSSRTFINYIYRFSSMNILNSIQKQIEPSKLAHKNSCRNKKIMSHGGVHLMVYNISWYNMDLIFPKQHTDFRNSISLCTSYFLCCIGFFYDEVDISRFYCLQGAASVQADAWISTSVLGLCTRGFTCNDGHHL